MGFRFQVVASFPTGVDRSAKATRPLLARELGRAAQVAKRVAIQLAPRDTGAAGLAGSIQAVKTAPLTWIVSPGKEYAPYVELGRPAGQRPPPSDRLIGWVTRHLGVQGREARGVAYVVARAIGRRGIPPRPFMAPAAAKAQEYLDRYFLGGLFERDLARGAKPA